MNTQPEALQNCMVQTTAGDTQSSLCSLGRIGFLTNAPVGDVEVKPSNVYKAVIYEKQKRANDLLVEKKSLRKPTVADIVKPTLGNPRRPCKQ